MVYHFHNIRIKTICRPAKVLENIINNHNNSNDNENMLRFVDFLVSYHFGWQVGVSSVIAVPLITTTTLSPDLLVVAPGPCKCVRVYMCFIWCKQSTGRNLQPVSIVQPAIVHVIITVVDSAVFQYKTTYSYYETYTRAHTTIPGN